MNTKKPPKNRPFLGLVVSSFGIRIGEPYWDIFFWAKKENGVIEPCFVDTELFEMPDICGWVDMPDIPETDGMKVIKL